MIEKAGNHQKMPKAGQMSNTRRVENERITHPVGVVANGDLGAGALLDHRALLRAKDGVGLLVGSRTRHDLGALDQSRGRAQEGEQSGGEHLRASKGVRKVGKEAVDL